MTDRLGTLIRDVAFERNRSTRLEQDLELIVINYENVRDEAGTYKDQQDELEKISRMQSERISELEDQNTVDFANNLDRANTSQKDLVKDMDDKYRDLQHKYDKLGKLNFSFPVLARCFDHKN